MTATTGERLLSDYLALLEGAALRLPPDRREELLEGIREHVAAARAAGELDDELAVRNLLDRLGEPEEIVAAASEDVPAAGAGWAPYGVQGLVPTRPGTGLETAAVLMLTVGSLLPVLGWLVGVALLWSSRRWTVREKLLGTLVVPGGPGLLLPLSFLAPGGGSCSSVSQSPLPAGTDTPEVGSFTTTCEASSLPGWVVIAVVAAALLLPVLVAVLLLRRARARAALEPPVMRMASSSAWGGLEVATVLVLAFGSFVVPFVSTVVGLALLWSSPRWTGTEKAVGTGLALLTPGLMLVAVLGGGPLTLPLGAFAGVMLALFGQIVAAGYLSVVLSRRKAR